MLPDLERLIRLQSLHNIVDDARRRIAAIPAQFEAFETKLNKLRTALSDAKQQLDDNREVRRNLEKEVSDAKSRLAKFQEHEMIVKTNEELWAVQPELTPAKSAGLIKKFIYKRSLAMIHMRDDGYIAEAK